MSFCFHDREDGGKKEQLALARCGEGDGGVRGLYRLDDVIGGGIYRFSPWQSFGNDCEDG